MSQDADGQTVVLITRKTSPQSHIYLSESYTYLTKTPMKGRTGILSGKS